MIYYTSIWNVIKILVISQIYVRKLFIPLIFLIQIIAHRTCIEIWLEPGVKIGIIE